jgi:hypothetical protein
VLSLDVDLFSIDDLWARYIVSEVSGDGNAEAGNSATAGRGIGAGGAGHSGQHPRGYYTRPFLNNPGNANEFPGGADPNAQALIMGTAGGTTPPTITGSGTILTCQNLSNFGWGHPADATFDKDFTAGGKFIYEVTVDSYASDQFVCPGFYDPAAAVSQGFGGNHDGAGVLATVTLMRIFRGPLESDYDAGTVIAMTSGTVVTVAANFDDDEVTFYMDGVTTGTKGLQRTTPVSNFLRPVLKAYKGTIMSINPIILHPVSGFETWG